MNDSFVSMSSDSALARAKKLIDQIDDVRRAAWIMLLAEESDRWRGSWRYKLRVRGKPTVDDLKYSIRRRLPWSRWPDEKAYYQYEAATTLKMLAENCSDGQQVYVSTSLLRNLEKPFRGTRD